MEFGHQENCLMFVKLKIFTVVLFPEKGVGEELAEACKLQLQK